MIKPESQPEPACLSERPPEANTEIETQHQLLQTIKRVGRTALHASFAIGIGLGAASLAGDSTVNTELGQAKFHTEITGDISGNSRINTPLFDVDYPTHDGPFGMEVTVEDLAVTELVDSITDEAETGNRKTPSLSEIFDSSAIEVNQAAEKHAAKYLLLLGSFSAIGYLATSKRGPTITKKKIISSLAVGSLAAGIPLVVSASTWNSDAFSEPTYSADIPPALDKANVIENLDKYDKSIADQARYSLRFIESIEKLNDRPEEEIAVRGLAISDIHQRNVFPTLKTLVDNYDISFIADNGDIVDWGTPLENGFFLGQRTIVGPTDTILRENTTGIADLGVPYYFTKGNHDDQDATIEPLSQLPNVRILETGDYYTQNGLIITGVGDPLFTPDLELGNDVDKTAEIEAGEKLQAELDNRAADIAIIHNPEAGKQVTRQTQLQISGHTHKYRFSKPILNTSPARLNTGTAGGAGLRNQDNAEGTETPQTFTVMNFSESCQLISLDQITITSLDGDPEFNVKHTPVYETIDPQLTEGRACQ
ncbi:metallophosphoesterase [Candidatus Saccharibacteria bacterium]|nr:metallophosphoesterase [Candidatus Saccharibacteria bacterium]